MLRVSCSRPPILQTGRKSRIIGLQQLIIPHILLSKPVDLHQFQLLREASFHWVRPLPSAQKERASKFLCCQRLYTGLSDFLPLHTHNLGDSDLIQVWNKMKNKSPQFSTSSKIWPSLISSESIWLDPVVNPRMAYRRLMTLFVIQYLN